MMQYAIEAGRPIEGVVTRLTTFPFVFIFAAKRHTTPEPTGTEYRRRQSFIFLQHNAIKADFHHDV
jgi:hypothetical protein